MANKIVYIDIESLMDLRQGYILSLPDRDPTEVANYLASDDYTRRDSDEFKFGTKEGYQDAVNRGIKTILFNSTITYLTVTVINSINGIINRNAIEQANNIPTVWVNVYPFKLSTEEIEIFRDALFQRLGIDTYIELVSIPKEELSPSWLSGSAISTVIMYDYAEWFRIHGQSVVTVSLPDIQFYFPKMYEVAPKTEDEIAEVAEIEQLGSLFELHRSFLEKFLRITFMLPLFYCNSITALDRIKDIDLAFQEEMKKHQAEVEANIDESGIIDQITGETL